MTVLYCNEVNFPHERLRHHSLPEATARTTSLHGLQIELHSQPVEFVGGIIAAIHSENIGRPGASLHELGLQVNLQKGIATFHAPASTILAANTTYWLIVSAESMLAERHTK